MLRFSGGNGDGDTKLLTKYSQGTQEQIKAPFAGEMIAPFSRPLSSSSMGERLIELTLGKGSSRKFSFRITEI